jgi:hypothetical protein
MKAKLGPERMEPGFLRHRRIDATLIEGGQGHAVGLCARLMTRVRRQADPSAGRQSCRSLRGVACSCRGRHWRAGGLLFSLAHGVPQQTWVASRTMPRQTGIAMAIPRSPVFRRLPLCTLASGQRPDSRSRDRISADARKEKLGRCYVLASWPCSFPF